MISFDLRELSIVGFLTSTVQVFFFSKIEIRSSSFRVEKWLFIGQCGIFKNKSSNDLELKVADFPKCVSIYRNHYFPGIQRNVFQVGRKVEVQTK